MDRFLMDLARARIGDTFNQYRARGPDDVPGAPARRRANLRCYLLERVDARVVALGEAAGYQGMRWSGIAFTSERDLMRWGLPYLTTSSGRRGGWSEPSGTLVHRLLEAVGAERRVILWNVVPTHPHRPGNPFSNRRPRRDEIAAGVPFAWRLIDMVQPRRLIAIGRVASSVLGEEAEYVRHPAHAGGAAFAAGMRAALAKEDRAGWRR